MKLITIEELKKEIEATGYYPTEELLYDTFNALSIFQQDQINPGQDVFALCLEGPPGAGKTAFAKMYRNIVSQQFFDPVELVEYQCDPATSEEKLKEDIRIVAVVTRNGKEVIIPGILVKTVQMLNEGKRVILFIDEYDKAREETDSFFLQFLQDGKLNAVQSGDMEIKPEYKNNLQVIFCKNDAREELSGPLTRRLRILRLDYMEPSLFYTVAKRVLIDDAKEKVEESLLNLVTLMYQNAYEQKDVYNRLPACSEMLIAIEDANRLMTLANAPKYILYRTIVKNMFKNKDDLVTFESNLSKSRNKDKKLAELIKEMQQGEESLPLAEQKKELNSLMAQTVFEGEASKFAEKIKEVEELISKYEKEFEAMRVRYQNQQEQEIARIRLESGQLIANGLRPKTIGNFEDESSQVKRGKNIFDISEGEDWVDVATMVIPNLSHTLLIEKLIEFGTDLVIYENGVLLQDTDNHKMIVFKELDENNQPRYRMMANHAVIPSTYLADVYAFVDFSKQVLSSQTTSPGIRQDPYYEINALVYNDVPLTYDTVDDHVYHVEIRDRVQNVDSLGTLASQMTCENLASVQAAHDKLMNEPKKVYVHA